MEMRRPTHLQKRDQVLLLWGWSLVFRWHLRVSSGGSGSGNLNPCLTRYSLRLHISNFRILVGLITVHCPLNKHLHNMGLIDEPICIACGMEDESAFHLLCESPSLISLRISTFSKPILSVEEYEEASASALLRFALVSVSICLSICVFFNHSIFHLCGAPSIQIFLFLVSFHFD
jgi:hypothetical protein